MSASEAIYITKSNGEKEPFDPYKIEYSLRKAKASDDVIDRIVRHISGEVEDGMSTSQIYKHAFFLLKKMGHPTAIRYSLKRAVMELGPSGFPFEQLIGEVYRAKGYTVETDKIVKGHCADHEIDVIAYNENKLIMVEAKYHNNTGIQSDLKVTLYVKARFDDLKQATFFYDTNRKLDEGWLITNTKFTTTAIKYAECQKLKIVGWNYPLHGSLQDMIDDAGLHPITSLSTLSANEKKLLLGNNVILCKTLLEHPDHLREINIGERDVAVILKEIKELYT